MIERSNFNGTDGDRPIPTSCPPEFRRRITEAREKRDAVKPVVEPVPVVAATDDPEAWELLKRFSAAVEQE